MSVGIHTNRNWYGEYAGAAAISLALAALSYYLNVAGDALIVQPHDRWDKLIEFHAEYYPYSVRYFTDYSLYFLHNVFGLTYRVAFIILQYTLSVVLGLVFYGFLRTLRFSIGLSLVGLAILMMAYPILGAHFEPVFTWDDFWEYLALVLAFWLLLRDRYIAATTVFTIGVLAREVTLIYYPIFIYAVFFRRGWRDYRFWLAALVPMAAYGVFMLFTYQSPDPVRFRNYEKNFASAARTSDTIYSLLVSFGFLWVTWLVALLSQGRRMLRDWRFRPLVVGAAFAVPVTTLIVLTMGLARETRLFFPPFVFVIPVSLWLLREKLPAFRWHFTKFYGALGLAALALAALSLPLGKALFPTFEYRAWHGFSQLFLGVQIGLVIVIGSVLLPQWYSAWRRLPTLTAPGYQVPPRTGMQFRFTRGELMLFGLFILGYVWMHFRAGLGFPTPWPDESHFLWQACSIAGHWRLFAPELNPERAIFWMPPLYFVVTGLVFKITGVSLLVARHLSLLYMLGAYTLLALALRQYPLRWLSFVILALAFMSGPFLAAGNVARMDALLFLIAAAAFYFLLLQRHWEALSLLFLSPLVHPNGLYLAAAGVGFILLLGRWRRSDWSLSRAGIVLAALTLMAWLIFAGYAALNWTDFSHDVMYQWHRKAGRNLSLILGTADNLILLIVAAGVWLFSWRTRAKVRELFVLIIPFWIIRAIGNEMWYDIFHVTALLLLSLTALIAAFHALYLRAHSDSNRLLRHSTFAIVGAVLLAGNLHLGTMDDLREYPNDVQWMSMRVSSDVQYITEGDVARIGAVIDSLGRIEGIETLRFYPRADAFLFLGHHHQNIQFVDRLFSGSRADAFLVHASRRLPYWWRFRNADEYEDVFGGPPPDSLIVHSRDSTEFWYVRTMDR